MSKEKSNSEIVAHFTAVLEQYKVYFLELLNTGLAEAKKKIDLVSYWLNDWLRYLNYEEEYSKKMHPKYKRGSIVQVNLGFNVGSEFGGLHYAITLEKEDNEKIPNIVIVPLTSIKPTTNIEKLNKDKSRLNIGTYIYDEITKKTNIEFSDYLNEIKNTKEKNKLLSKSMNEKARILQKHFEELDQMKKGTIVLLRQIRVISKMRIYAPTNKNDLLNKIRVSEEILNQIDSRLKNLFFN